MLDTMVRFCRDAGVLYVGEVNPKLEAGYRRKNVY
jgi:hypothetical protein